MEGERKKWSPPTLTKLECEIIQSLPEFVRLQRLVVYEEVFAQTAFIEDGGGDLYTRKAALLELLEMNRVRSEVIEFVRERVLLVTDDLLLMCRDEE